MSGSHVAPSSHHHYNDDYNNNNHSGGGGWKVAILVVVLLIAIAALCFLLWQLFGENIMGLFGGSTSQTANMAPGIFTQVGAEYGSGKNVAGNLTVSQGTQRPAEIPAEAEDVVLLDISWTGSKEQTEPVYLTVSDPSFTDGDGLSVYEYEQPQAAWDLIGTYRIQNNSVTFQADEMTSFAFQVISSNPVPTASPEPVATAEPSPTPEPTPEPTPAPMAVVDYGSYPTVQTGAFAMVDQIEDDQAYVFALVQDLPDDTAASSDGDSDDGGSDAGDSGNSGDGTVDFTYVDAPADTTAQGTDTAGGDTAAAAVNPSAPKATVLINRGNNTLGAVEMPLVQTDDGTWCLAGPITEGMLWTANRDYYSGDYSYSLGNNERYLNIDDNAANIILTDNSVRTRWLTTTATLADGSEIRTVDYRDSSRYYVSSLGNVVETLSDSLFPAGEVPAESNPQASQVTYLGTEAPADQTMLRETLRFTVTTDETLAQQIVLFKLDSSKTLPASAQAVSSTQVTVPAIDVNTDLSTLDIRNGDSLLQLGVDYTVAAKVYNNSTVVVVISFMGKYTGQIVRSYSGTYFRVDASSPTPSPEPSATPEPTQTPSSNSGGGGGGGGTSNWVAPPSSTSTASSSDTIYVDDDSSTDT